MLNGSEHEEHLKEFLAFESRMQDEGDRETARVTRRTKQYQESVYQLETQIRNLQHNLNDQQQRRRGVIDERRSILNDARTEAQRELRKMSILIDPRELNVDEYANVFLYKSDWTAAYVYTQTNDKPVNCIDLCAVFQREYDIVDKSIAVDYSSDRCLFSKSFKTEDEAWSYYERNRNKIFREHVKPIIGDEEGMNIDVDPGFEFDRLFDFRLIYQTGTYRTWDGTDRRLGEHSYRSFEYDGYRNRNAEVSDIDKYVMKVDIVERSHEGEITSIFPCTLTYRPNRMIEIACPEGVSKDDRTCFKELCDAIYQGPLRQVCVEPEMLIRVKHVWED